MPVPETMKQLKGWKYPLYVQKEFFDAPELIDTLVEHGAPRDSIKLKDIEMVENFDFYAYVRRYPNDYDSIVVRLLPHVEKGVNHVSISAGCDIISMRITSPDWFTRNNKRI
jgi:hypothetical protein